MIRVFLADDHGVVRVGLRHLLAEVGGFEVIGEAADGRRVLNAPELGRCDVLVLDLSLPVVSGMEVLHRLHRDHPDLPVVVHSMHPEDQFAARMLAAGAVAYVAKDRAPIELVEAVRRAAKVGPPRKVAPEPPASPLATLTGREHQIFLRIVQGHAVTDIAAELDLHPSTVSNHLAAVRKKLGRQTVAELVAFALTEGILEAGPG